MRTRIGARLIGRLGTALCAAAIGAGGFNAQEPAQQEPAKPATAGGTEQTMATAPVIRTESRIVLVDTVVTDKKGNYVTDLEQKDFRVWEDDKEQPIKSFSSATNVSPTKEDQPRYLVLFFDNSTMEAGDQISARDAASKFIDANAGPQRLIALVDFGGVVRVAQNFTADADRLKKVVAAMRNSSVTKKS